MSSDRAARPLRVTYLLDLHSSYGTLVNQVYHYLRYVQNREHESSINKAFVSLPC